MTPIERFEFAANDMFEAREFLDHAYGWRVAVDRAGVLRHAIAISMTQAGGVALARAESAGEVSYRVSGKDYVVIDTLLAGTFQIEDRHGTHCYGPGDLFIANHPGATFRATTHDVLVLTTTLPAALLANAAADLSAAADVSPRPLEFLSTRPNPGTEQRWRSVNRLVAKLFDDPHADGSPLVIGAAGRLLAACALATFANTAGSEPVRSRDGLDAHPETLRRAVAFIEANPDKNIGLADIARAASVTGRAVQLAFRRHLDTTPITYLRLVRLACAHEELRNARPGDGTTVTSVAYRWGFSSLSRFAEFYRAEYGTNPSVTLRWT